MIVSVPCVAEGRLYDIGSLVAMPPLSLEAGNEHQGEGAPHTPLLSFQGSVVFPTLYTKGLRIHLIVNFLFETYHIRKQLICLYNLGYYKGLTVWILGKWQFVPVELVMCYLPI